MHPQPYLSQSVESTSKVEVERETRTIFSFPSCKRKKLLIIPDTISNQCCGAGGSVIKLPSGAGAVIAKYGFDSGSILLN
jgi:hypothetical protein